MWLARHTHLNKETIESRNITFLARSKINTPEVKSFGLSTREIATTNNHGLELRVPVCFDAVWLILPVLTFREQSTQNASCDVLAICKLTQ